MMRLRLAILGASGLVWIWLTIGCVSPQPEPAGREVAAAPVAGTEVVHVDPAEAAEQVVSAGWVILDVRTPEEFKAGHIAGATNVNFNADDFADLLGGLNPSRDTLVYCRSGRRSTASLETLKQLGFARVIHLDGGYGAWEKAELPVEK